MIEEISQKPCVELFDFFSGSSIGTIIICGLLLTDDGKTPRYTAKELYEKVKKNSIDIFSSTWWYRVKNVWGLYGPKYPSYNLENVLSEIFGDKKIKDLLKPVYLPTYDLLSGKPIYFNVDKYGELALKDVLMATTAAPTYFPSKPMEIDGVKYEFIDSGVVVNNTVEVAFLEARKKFPLVGKEDVHIMLLGTGQFDYSIKQINGGLLSWAANITDVFLSAGSENELHELSLTLCSDNYLIINIPMDNKFNELDNTSPDYINYYYNTTEKWLHENKDMISKFCKKLLKDRKNIALSS